MDRGAVGIFSSFGRIGANSHIGTINILYGDIRIIRVRHTYESSSSADCAPGWVYVEYYSGGVLQTSSQTIDGLARQYLNLSPLQILNCNNNQSLELRFRLGASGYWEVRANNSVVLSLTGIDLGYTGYLWDGIQIAPSGMVDQAASNGGMSSCYINEIDTYGAGNSPLVDEDYSTLTDAQLWSDLGAGGLWVRYTANGLESTVDPAKSGSRVTSNINYMQRTWDSEGEPEPPPGAGLIDNTELCCDEGDPGTVSHEGGGQSAGGFLVQTPTIGVPIGCVGGGTVPTEADIVYSETWWGS